MSRRLKLVEELNMEATVESTVEERTQGTMFKVTMVSQRYIDCKKALEKIVWSIKKFIASTRGILEEVIPTDKIGRVREQYNYCLKNTIVIALDDADKLIEEYNVTDKEEIKLLREQVINLLDEVEVLFN